MANILESIKNTTIPIIIPGSVCDSSACMTTEAGIVDVSTFLRGHFGTQTLIFSSVSTFFKKIWDKKTKDMTVDVCFQDGQCIKMKLVSAFSTIAFVPVSPSSTPNTSGGNESTSTNNGGADSVSIGCSQWSDYYVDGAYQFSTCDSYVIMHV